LARSGVGGYAFGLAQGGARCPDVPDSVFEFGSGAQKNAELEASTDSADDRFPLVEGLPRLP
jgi:hypothetical protein